MTNQLRRYAYLLADKHLNELPKEELIRSCPSHYGYQLTDEHKLFMWNGLVEHYEQLEPLSLYEKYKLHVVEGEPILKVIVYSELEPDTQELIEEIITALWKKQE